MPFDLIIWDCDGCLVDSEIVACGLGAQMMTEWGFPISLEEFLELFTGQSSKQVSAYVEERTGRSYREYEREDYLPRLKDAFSQSLKACAGVEETLRSLSCQHCIASGSERARVEHSLIVTKLMPFFEGKIFTSSQVENGKPAPDVFLFAAERMGIEPCRCLVIEDSVNGIRAGKAAGMKVFAYLGGSHVNEAWRERVAAEKPDVTFDDMRELPSLIERTEQLRSCHVK